MSGIFVMCDLPLSVGWSEPYYFGKRIRLRVFCRKCIFLEPYFVRKIICQIKNHQRICFPIKKLSNEIRFRPNTVPTKYFYDKFVSDEVFSEKILSDKISPNEIQPFENVFTPLTLLLYSFTPLWNIDRGVAQKRRAIFFYVFELHLSQCHKMLLRSKVIFKIIK